jgi:hypothetical protein
METKASLPAINRSKKRRFFLTNNPASLKAGKKKRNKGGKDGKRARACSEDGERE